MRLKFLITITAFVFASCTNNNHNTGGIDSASVSTDPAMQGKSAGADTGMTSSDSTDIRFPMSDSTHGARSASGTQADSSQQ